MLWVFIALTAVLLITNLFTLYWSLKKRIPIAKEMENKKVKKLWEFLILFEREQETLLRIEKMNPDHVFLQRPDR